MKKNLLLAFVLLSLIAGCSKDDEPQLTKVPEISKSKIICYENIRLGGVENQNTTGCFFSTKEGKVFTSSGLSGGIASSIDLVYVGTDKEQIFVSPNTKLSPWGLPCISNATKTTIINDLEGEDPSFLTKWFDDLEEDALLKDILISEEGEASLQEISRVILFENADGQKGIIKITEIKSGKKGYILFDLKVQRYPGSSN